jgi:flagellar motor protein MotB
MANILFQQESYKRGMVLGLTMAEIVLVILFTLLLVLATLLTDKEREESKLKNRLTLVESQKFSTVVQQYGKDPERFFRELVIAREKAAQTDRLQQQLQEQEKKNSEMRATLERERAARQQLEHNKGRDRLSKWPPIISLSEADGYYFAVGSAELSDEFKAALTDKVVPKILQIAAEYPDVNVIEVVGHTDEQPIRERYSNLDSMLFKVLKNGDVASLIPADNAGLGMARAVAVVTRLLQDGRLQPRFARILPMSGAQLIDVDQTLSQGSGGDVKKRRRIEIRLRKYEPSGKAE